jgi:hypothetical protein
MGGSGDGGVNGAGGSATGSDAAAASPAGEEGFGDLASRQGRFLRAVKPLLFREMPLAGKTYFRRVKRGGGR